MKRDSENQVTTAAFRRWFFSWLVLGLASSTGDWIVPTLLRVIAFLRLLLWPILRRMVIFSRCHEYSALRPCRSASVSLRDLTARVVLRSDLAHTLLLQSMKVWCIFSMVVLFTSLSCGRVSSDAGLVTQHLACTLVSYQDPPRGVLNSWTGMLSLDVQCMWMTQCSTQDLRNTESHHRVIAKQGRHGNQTYTSDPDSICASAALRLLFSGTPCQPRSSTIFRISHLRGRWPKAWKRSKSSGLRGFASLS